MITVDPVLVTDAPARTAKGLALPKIGAADTGDEAQSIAAGMAVSPNRLERVNFMANIGVLQSLRLLCLL